MTAVAAEVVSAPLSTPTTAGRWPHVLEGAYEEGAELAGWILIAGGLAVVALARASRLVSPPGQSSVK